MNVIINFLSEYFSSEYNFLWHCLKVLRAIIVSLAFLAVSLSTWASDIWAPSFGPYSVGHATLQVPRTTGVGAPETMQVDLWYPVLPNTINNLHPPLTTYHQLLLEQSGILTGSFPSLPNVKAYESTVINGSQLSLTSAKGKFPLIVFLTGTEAPSIVAWTLMESLASQGYVIIAPYSRPDSYADVFIGDYVPDTVPSVQQEHVDQLNTAMSYIMSSQSPIVASILKDEIGLIGWSFGGATSLRALYEGGANMTNVKSVVTWAPGYGPVSLDSTDWVTLTSAEKVPIITLADSDDTDVPLIFPQEVFLNSQAQKGNFFSINDYYVFLHGAGHVSFIDACDNLTAINALDQVLPSAYQAINIYGFIPFFETQGCPVVTTSGYSPMLSSTGVEITELYTQAMFDTYLKHDVISGLVLTKAFAQIFNLPVTWFQPGQTSP